MSNFEKSISFFGDVDVGGGGGLEANEAAGQVIVVGGGAFGTRSLRGIPPIIFILDIYVCRYLK